MTDPVDALTRLRDHINGRLEIARAATPGPWEAHPVHIFMDGRIQARVAPLGGPKVFADVISGGDFEYFRGHDPASDVRRYERDLRTLERHRPFGGQLAPEMRRGCVRCRNGSGLCDEIRDLFDTYPEVER